MPTKTTLPASVRVVRLIAEAQPTTTGVHSTVATKGEVKTVSQQELVVSGTVDRGLFHARIRSI